MQDAVQGSHSAASSVAYASANSDGSLLSADLATSSHQLSVVSSATSISGSSTNSPSRLSTCDGSLRGGNGERVLAARYILGKTLGGGVEGKVKLCIDSHTGEEVAVKIVPEKNYTRSKNAMRRILDEVAIMRRLEHTNVVTCRDFQTDVLYPCKDGRTKRVLIM